MNNLELVFGKGVGEFLIGGEIEIYTSKFDFEFYPKSENNEFSWDFYDFFDGSLNLYVDNGNKVDSIFCRKECYFRGQNLIGLTLEQFLELTQIEPTGNEKYYVTKGDSYQNQTCYDFEDDLGMQIWVYRKRIVTVCIFSFENVDD